MKCTRLQPLWGKLIKILENLRGKPFADWKQAAILGWSTTEGAIEKGSVALMSMLLKIIVIDWWKMIQENREFDYKKVWKIFWNRAKNQWRDLARDKSNELRNVRQRGSDTKSTWIGIQRQLTPIGSMDRTSCEITCRIKWTDHDEF